MKITITGTGFSTIHGIDLLGDRIKIAKDISSNINFFVPII